MKCAAFALLAGSAAAYTAPTMTFSLGKKKAAAPAAVPKVSLPAPRRRSDSFAAGTSSMEARYVASPESRRGGVAWIKAMCAQQISGVTTSLDSLELHIFWDEHMIC